MTKEELEKHVVEGAKFQGEISACVKGIKASVERIERDNRVDHKGIYVMVADSRKEIEEVDDKRIACKEALTSKVNKVEKDLNQKIAKVDSKVEGVPIKAVKFGAMAGGLIAIVVRGATYISTFLKTFFLG